MTTDESTPLNEHSSRQHDAHHYSRANHRQRPGRPHDRHRTTDDVEQVRANLRHKPPVAARPAQLKTGAASSNGSRRPLTCPPCTLDLSAIVPPPSSASACQTPEQVTVDQEPPQRTDIEDRPASAGESQALDHHQARTSASSDTEVSSGDSATSGFCSGPSDVIVDKTTVVSGDNSETMTLGRNAKRQKPVVKPKRKYTSDKLLLSRRSL